MFLNVCLNKKGLPIIWQTLFVFIFRLLICFNIFQFQFYNFTVFFQFLFIYFFQILWRFFALLHYLSGCLSYNLIRFVDCTRTIEFICVFYITSLNIIVSRWYRWNFLLLFFSYFLIYTCIRSIYNCWYIIFLLINIVKAFL